MKKGDKVILTSTHGLWRWGDPGWFHDGMKGEFVGYGDCADDLFLGNMGQSLWCSHSGQQQH